MMHLRDSLEGILDSAGEESSEYRIAYYLLQNCYTAKKIFIQDVAEHCYVSKATVSRFCRALGYDDYQELNDALFQAFMRDSSSKFNRYIESENFGDAYFNDLLKTCELCKSAIRLQDVMTVAADIRTYGRVGLLGRLQSNSVAIDLQHDLLACQKVVTAPLMPVNQLSFIQNSDENTYLLVISCSGTYLRDVINQAVFSPEHTPKIVLLTNNTGIQKSKYYSQIISIPGPNTYAGNPLQLKLFCNLVAIAYGQLTAAGR